MVFNECSEKVVELVKGGVKTQVVEVTVLVNMCHNCTKCTGKMRYVFCWKTDYYPDTFALEVFC